ncbi:hypothetical protein QJS10_CPA08g00979 [Acorus calamus]|uniref:ferric-chelate reductase (NADH) n=1 Tax=Acorus calamus TaxID=4465 RepID=A0AAV9EEX1_ACOCL|nr:hypothetical protein QJS10_CPA08g00979 [Acorus calamus]
MADLSAQQPLLSNKGVEIASFNKARFSASAFAQWALIILMWMILVAWVALIFFYPSEFVQEPYSKFVQATRGTIFGVTGSIFLIFSGPVLVIACLSFVYMIFFQKEYHEGKYSKFPKFRLWTFPILIDGPFGVVSAAELIGIMLFSAYILWVVVFYALHDQSLIHKFPIPSKERSYLAMELMGLRFGLIGLFCLAFLFLPISRGSILLRIIDIPFEHATRYHVWLGHLTMAIFTLHGLLYVIAWALQGRLLSELLQWKNIGIANFPGVISLLAGLLMWVTSLHPVRKNYFELFFYTHQLYVVFIVFLAMHVGDFIFSIAAGGIFLFILDRFLRFCQSRRNVGIISASCHPCGTVEIVLSKPPCLHYNALSFVFLQIRELSFLQWHPFSVSSSPLDGRHHISVLIKVLGEWTEKLRDSVLRLSEQYQDSSKAKSHQLTASVEGPYGHELAYHLMYENLILVAGGIGISPFLAILSDILHRIQDKKPCLPKNVLVIWAVKRSKEFSLLSVLNAQSICPSFYENLNLDIQAFVTQEQEPPLEDGKVNKSMSCPFPTTSRSSMSSLVGTGHNIWSGIYVILSMIGFIILFGLMELFYIRPFGISSWWYLGLLFIICMVASVVVFGGLVVILWNQWEKRSMDYEKIGANYEKSDLIHDNDPTGESLASLISTQYGCRPNFKGIFESFGERVGYADVGVIVCGPPSLQTSVAKECRSQNFRGRWKNPIFHFNSHSFDL